jgi:hypothetical protein
MGRSMLLPPILEGELSEFNICNYGLISSKNTIYIRVPSSIRELAESVMCTTRLVPHPLSTIVVSLLL